MENDKTISTFLHALTNQENDFEPFVDTQEQQRDVANEWKAAITTYLWYDIEHMENTEYTFLFLT